MGLDRRNLAGALREARSFLALPDNDFAWSSWQCGKDACRELDTLIAEIESGQLPRKLDLEVLFAVTGPIQEVSLSSGWGKKFLELASRFDTAMEGVYG